MTRIAVLGLGRMGQAIAQRLLDTGERPVVWNRTPGRADDLVAAGAAEAASREAAVRGADVVITSLTGDDAVCEVLLRWGMALESISGLVVDCSTVSPQTSRMLGEQYAGRFVACPIAGAPQLVRDGHALLITGGAAEAKARARELLAGLSDTWHDAGDDPARAALVKLLNNYLLLSGLAALADTVAVGQAAGFDDGYLRELLGGLATVAPGLRNRIDGLLDHEHEGWFTAELGEKDLRLFEEAARAVGARIALAEPVRAGYCAAVAMGLGGSDLTAIMEPLRRPPRS